VVNDAWIRKKYERFCLYWPDFDWPDFQDIDFGFRPCKEEWGSVEWLPDGGIRMSLNLLAQRYSSIAKPCLFHEMTHLVCGPKVGHGKAFYRAQLEALNRGAVFDGLI